MPGIFIYRPDREVSVARFSCQADRRDLLPFPQNKPYQISQRTPEGAYTPLPSAHVEGQVPPEIMYLLCPGDPTKVPELGEPERPSLALSCPRGKRLPALQARLRDCVLRRGQGDCLDWSQTRPNEIEDLFSGEPNRRPEGEEWGYDARVALTMDLLLHWLYAAFKFPIYREDGDEFIPDKVPPRLFQPRTFVFDDYPLPDVKHGQAVLLPHTPAHCTRPNYFASLVPPAEILNEHFRQAILRNASPAPLPAEFYKIDVETV
ncbi:hypothetical protein BDK51DRAFT_41274 [Blyttiomyces helicus]|uniref:Uncharacterized protein n=1 Tax=Blyttiomyces helicus TaxID=388810 RepID=A0A4P9WH70_9FUNG|nr:hypothetical protein BDK51DRAFT_41274 [Blyttiomyces helicus]|eukprot:RKO90748.1 hypothetical protein BDK51DRAFT_41274 [Blyttiomyces helicus]